MNNSSFDPYAIQQPKKKTNVLTIIAGAVLASFFLICCFSHLYAFLLSINIYSFTSNYYSVHDKIYLITQFMENPLATFFLLASSFLLLVYTLLTAVLKGKKIKLILLTAFLSIIISCILSIFSAILAYCFVPYSSDPWAYRMFLHTIFNAISALFWCAPAVIGVIICFVNNKKTSLILGIAGTGSAFICLIVSMLHLIGNLVIKSSSMINEIINLTSDMFLLIAIMAVFLLLRPAKD